VPSGNDYRLLGHMPGFVAGSPDKKHFDEREFPTADASVKIRGAVYIVDYEPQAKQDPKITAVEIVENYPALPRLRLAPERNARRLSGCRHRHPLAECDEIATLIAAGFIEPGDQNTAALQFRRPTAPHPELP
jgi:hypothetical protein